MIRSRWWRSRAQTNRAANFRFKRQVVVWPFHFLIGTALAACHHCQEPTRLPSMSEALNPETTDSCQNCGTRPATRVAPQRTDVQQQRFGPRKLCEECYRNMFGPDGTETGES